MDKIWNDEGSTLAFDILHFIKVLIQPIVTITTVSCVDKGQSVGRGHGSP